jgi:hypothetical protein
MKKDEVRKLVLEIRIKIHYKELFPKVNKVSHYCFLRMDADTYGASLDFKIPNGLISNIYRLSLISQYKDKVLFERDINAKEEPIFYLGGKYGSGCVQKDEEYTTVNWTIPTLLKRGQMCKLMWFTERKEKGDR